MKFSDLHDYTSRTGVKKSFVAKALGVSRFQMAGLLYPDRYPVVLTDELIEKLSDLLNQRPAYVRRLYSRAA